jgi:hypothetical protein
MTPDFRALCAELADALNGHTSLYEGHESELVARARAALAQPEPQRKDCPGCEGTPVASNSPCAVCGRAQPVSVAPTDEEMLDLAHDCDLDRFEGERSYPDGTVVKEGCWEAWDHQLIAFARAIQQRCATTQPEPEALTVQECNDMRKHRENCIYECSDGDIQLDGLFSREDLLELARTIPANQQPPLGQKAAETTHWRPATPQPSPVPVAMSADTLAAIIREMDGTHRLGANALAEAILSHPGSRWSPTINPVPVPISEEAP